MVSLNDITDWALVYEDPDNHRNVLACDRWATAGQRLVHDTWVHKDLFMDSMFASVHGIADRPERYIYPIGCFHSPFDWARDAWDMIPPAILADAADCKAFILFDQAQEGNADPDIWRWFYHGSSSHGVPAEMVVYLTSDHFAESSHDAYCREMQIATRMHVISTWFNQHILMRNVLQGRWPAPSASRWLEDKPRDVALFNSLNRMPHAHRRQLFLAMLDSDLIRGNLVSMPAFDPSISCLPLTVDTTDLESNLFNTLNTEIYRRSYISVVTETYVDDAQLLIGEKVFKPMLCCSPFMVLGTKGTLARLRECGFSTFDMLWDESYDLLDDPDDRVRAIVKELEKLKRHPNLRSHLAAASDAIFHNQALLLRSWEESPDCRRLLAIWHGSST